MKKIFVFLSLIFAIDAYALETGPKLNPLKIQYMYSYDSIYIRFSDSAMPGCHGDNSGRLYSDNPLFKELYGQILTMNATGGMVGRVLYNVDQPGGNQWGDCSIQGLVAYPN